MRMRNNCTEFLLVGNAVREEDGSFALDSVRLSLCKNASFAASTEHVILSSANGAAIGHFFLPNGLCSAPLSSEDVAWMEDQAGVRRGYLFALKRYQEEGATSSCELAWEPMKRYQMLAHTLKRPRGAKTAEHLENLRRSDPLINLSAWHCWTDLHQYYKQTWHAKVHQQAMINRSFRAHQRSILLQSHDERLPAAPREERTSADSVISLLVEPSLADLDESEATQGMEANSPSSVLDSYEWHPGDAHRSKPTVRTSKKVKRHSNERPRDWSCVHIETPVQH